VASGSAASANYAWLAEELQTLMTLAPAKHWTDGPTREGYSGIAAPAAKQTPPVSIAKPESKATTASSTSNDANWQVVRQWMEQQQQQQRQQFEAMQLQLRDIQAKQQTSGSTTNYRSGYDSIIIKQQKADMLTLQDEYAKLRKEIVAMRAEMRKNAPQQSNPANAVVAAATEVRTEVQIVRDTIYIERPVITEVVRVVRDTIVNTVERTVEKTNYVPKVETKVEYVKEELFNLPPDVILFDIGKHAIKPQYNSRLNFYATQLKRFPEVNVQLVGHTDATGNAAANKALSERRANAVKQYLIARGVDASRIQEAGEGAAAPAADNNSSVSKSQNRRVEISFAR
jgi:outer membrane protein OmpA-like peptidoglycan-associated protein